MEQVICNNNQCTSSVPSIDEHASAPPPGGGDAPKGFSLPSGTRLAKTPRDAVTARACLCTLVIRWDNKAGSRPKIETRKDIYN